MALMFGKPLTLEQRLEKNVTVIMSVTVSLSTILMLGKRTVCEKTKTASTNGRDETYGRKFCDDLSDAELRFVILHECYHKMFRHLITWRHLWKINPRKANMACDYVINLMIWQAYGSKTYNGNPFIAMPDNLCYDEKYDGMSAAEIFDLLDEEGNDNCGGGDSLDDHNWEEAEDMGEEEVKELEREIESAVRQGDLAASKLGASNNPHANKALQPKVDWKSEIRTFATATCTGSDISTWSKLHRRYMGAGYTMPSTYSLVTEELVLAIDASGSTFGDVMAQFLGEIQRIATTLKVKRVRLLYWDTAVSREEVYRQDNLHHILQTTKPVGGGGTMIECVPEYIQANKIKPSAIVVLTDGELGGSWGKWGSTPLLWCIVNNKRAKPNAGKVIHVSTR